MKERERLLESELDELLAWLNSRGLKLALVGYPYSENLYLIKAVEGGAANISQDITYDID